MMNNPFEIIETRLSTIETLLLEIKIDPVEKKSETVNVKEASLLLKVSEQSIHNYIKKGLLPAKKVGRVLIINRSDIDNALQDVKSLKYKR